MLTWAAVVALVLGLVTWLVGDPAVVLSNALELAAVVAVFALVCASEAWH